MKAGDKYFEVAIQKATSKRNWEAVRLLFRAYGKFMEAQEA